MVQSGFIHSMLCSIPYLLLFILCYCIAWTLYTRFFHPLKNIPGPFSASVSHHWKVSKTVDGHMDEVQQALHRKFGPLVRISPNEVACAAPEALGTIYPTQNPLSKTDFYPVMSSKGFSKYSDLFSCVDEKLHASRRRIVHNVYSLSNVLQSEQYINNCSELLIESMGKAADTNRSFDLGEWMTWYAFDVVGELYFGDMFGFMRRGEDYRSYLASMSHLLPVLVTLASAPTYWRPFVLGSSLINSHIRGALKAMDYINKEVEDSVATRMAKADDQSSRRDLLQQFLNIAQDKGEKVDFGLGEVKVEIWGGFVAGSDTTAVALRSVFYNLLITPEAYLQLQAEIDDASQSGRLSSPVKFAEATRLPFLCACIKEGMRLHPSVALTLPRYSPPGGITVARTYIPEGYRVGMNAAVVQRDKDIFGHDSDLFRPMRWLEDEARATVMDKHMLVFGAGTRTCIGKNISLAEIHKIIPQILQHYDLELAPDAAWKTKNFWFHKQSGLRVLIRRRDTNTAVAS